jgi:hypothetical protein
VQVTAGSAAIDVLSTGILTFQNNSSGGAAAFNIASGGTLNFSGATGNVTAGSIAGAGEIDLGASQTMTVGSNNLSTSFSGNIFGTTGSSLIKVGLDTLTLSGNDVLPGGITLLTGGLALDSLGAAGGGGGISFGATPATLWIDPAALGFGGHFFAPVAYPTNSGGLTIDLPSLTFTPATSVTYNKTNSTLAADNGTKAVTFDHLNAHATQFVALDDHSGGTRIKLCITSIAPGDFIDRTHHPAGQHSPTSGPDIIVLNGANDTGNGAGGADEFVAGAPGVVMIGGSGNDTFDFLKIKASPASHPDTVVNFHHGDLIDFYDLHFFVPGQHHIVFIGAQSFDTYQDRHPTVTGLVRYAAGVIEVDVNRNPAPSFAVKVHGAPHLHFGYLASGEPLQDFHGDVLIY